MLEFLSPAILWGLAALSIPVIIHFIRNITRKKIPFSTLAFFKEMQKQSLNRLKFVQYLLLLLRLLFILFLISAFAQPVWRSNSGISFAGKDVIVILDNSNSVFRNDPEKKNWNTFISTFRKIDESSDQATRYNLYSTSSGVIFRDSSSMDISLIRQIGITGFGSARLTDVLDLASVSPDDSREKIFIIFSDRQQYSMSTEVDITNRIEKLSNSSVLLFADYERDSSDNDAIIKLTNWSYSTNPSSFITFQINKLGDEKNEVAFYDGQKRIGQKFLSGKYQEDLKLEIGNKKKLTGIAELPGDKYLDDNQYYWGFDISRPANILVAGDTAAMRPILALTRIPDMRQYVRTTIVDQRGMFAQVGKNWDWIFMSPENWNNDLDKLIKQFLSGGTKLFLLPGKSELSFISAMASIVRKKVSLITLDNNQQVGIKNWKFAPQMRDYPVRAFVNKYYPVKSRALIKYDNGMTFIGKSGSVNFITAPIGGNNGNIDIHPGLPLWLLEFLPAQSHSRAFWPGYVAGKDTVINLPAEWRRYSELTLTGPKGKYNLQNQNGLIRLSGKSINTPGHYEISNIETDKLYFSVNINPLEFSKTYYENDGLQFMGDGQNINQPHSLWKFFILLALIILAIETFIRYKNRDFGT